MSIKPIESFVDDDFYYPEEDDLQKFIANRNRTGRIWLTAFIAATIVAIVALSALLYTIVRDSFGYVIIQNTQDPAQLVEHVEEARMLAAAQMSSEDDKELVKAIADDPYAIGYFGHAYYADNTDKLRAVSVNGAQPNAETTAAGKYPYTRPIFIYADSEQMQAQPHVSGFVNYYLNNIATVSRDAGYFAPDETTLQQNRQIWLEANGLNGADFPLIDPATLPADTTLTVAGSSTMYPVSRQIAIGFRKAGYGGKIKLDQVGTTAGFELFCQRGGTDINNASRPIKQAEAEACDKAGRSPLAFNIGTDALVIAVSQKNDFLQDVTPEQLRRIFTDYENWSDVDPSFPDEPIRRFIPGADSGTLDFFTAATFGRNLNELSAPELVLLLQTNLSKGRVRALEAETPFAERTPEELLALVNQEVVKPRVKKSYNLVESIFNKAEIEATAATIPNSVVKFNNWLSWDFLVSPQASIPEYAGIRTAILGSLWVIFITIIVSLPLGVGAAIYLEEYAATVRNPTMRRINGIIQTNINNLAGVPSIIYGLLGLAVFVRMLEPLTSGTALGINDPATANGRTIVSAGLTLALLILPIIIINAQEAIKAVPQSLRQAGMGLGATKWQTIWAHVLPNAIPGILTGNILAVSRAVGETAPLVVVGVSTFITTDPASPFSKFTTLPAQIYQWTSRPQDEFRNIAAAAIIVLLVLLLSLNAAAVLLRNRYSKKLA